MMAGREERDHTRQTSETTGDNTRHGPRALHECTIGWSRSMLNSRLCESQKGAQKMGDCVDKLLHVYVRFKTT